MPRIVDRDQRRAEIVDAYLRVVARDGIELASSRAVAAELGVASGALWHYFRDFDDVLYHAFRGVFDRTNERIAERTAGSRGLRALATMLAEILPLTKETHDEALVVVSLWGRVPSRPPLGVFQSEAEGLWREAVLGHLRQAQQDGQVAVRAPIGELADILLVLGIGQQVEHVMQTEVAEPARQWQLVDVVLRPWLTPSGRAVLDDVLSGTEGGRDADARASGGRSGAP